MTVSDLTQCLSQLPRCLAHSVQPGVCVQFKWKEPEDTGGRDIYLYHLHMMTPGSSQEPQVMECSVLYLLLPMPSIKITVVSVVSVLAHPGIMNELGMLSVCD